MAQDCCPDTDNAVSLNIFSPSWAAADGAASEVAGVGVTELPPHALSAVIDASTRRVLQFMPRQDRPAFSRNNNNKNYNKNDSH